MTEPAGTKEDYSFGQIAIKESLCSFQQVKECLDIQSRLRGLGMSPKKLGEILIEKGYLTAEQAAEIARKQSMESTGRRFHIPGYEVVARIGQGAMGSVYKARQLSMDRIVAIKVLSAKHSGDRAYAERFLREARAVAKLNHENVISGIDVGESNGVRYFVMEYVDGVPVSAVLRREGGRLDERRCLEIGLQIARALAHAHKHGIVHRDVKPENIMITPDNVAKLCDLGLAKQAAKEDPNSTKDGMSVGTPHYIAPEQARGEESIDIRADIYSLGASLYHLATGTTPFTGPNAMVVMTRHVTEPPEPPRLRHPALSEAFSNLILKMMSKRREDRQQDPDALIADIEFLLRGGAATTPAPRRPASSISRPGAEPGLRRKTELPRSRVARWRSSSASGPVFILAFLGVAAVAVVLVLNARDSSTPAPPPVVRSTPPPAPPAAMPDEVEDVQKELSEFRGYVDARIVNPALPDRFTAPYAQIHERIEHYKKLSRFSAQQAWEEELGAYAKKVNALINERIWADIEKRALEHLAAGRTARASEELNRLEEVYRWFRRDGAPEMTEAGRAREALAAKIVDESRVTYIQQKTLADQAFRDPARRDEAYRILDALAASATREQKLEIDRTRAQYAEQDVRESLGEASNGEGSSKALERIKALKALHAGNLEIRDLLDRMGIEIRDRRAKAAAEARGRASEVYSGEFLPRFLEAMRQRDLVAARRHLHALYFSKERAPLQPAFLPEPVDAALLRAYLDPARAAFPEIRRAVALAEQGYHAARGAGGMEAAMEAFLDLRVAALLEELLDQALEGSRHASKDAGKFKNGYSPALADALSAEPAPRRPGEPPTLNVTTRQSAGTATVPMPLAPRAPGGPTEDDLISLARRSYSPGPDFAAKAEADAGFALRAFLLNVHADRLSWARTWYDKLTTPETQLGLARYADRLKAQPSAREEAEARKLYEEAYDLYVKKKDEAGAARKFRECLEKYSATEYMKARLPAGKTRIEIVEGLLQQLDPAVRPKAGAKAGPKEVFGTAEVRDLGKHRFDVTYDFKDDKQLLRFTGVPGAFGGAVTAAPAEAGARVEGNGVWYWNAPVKGNVVIEVTFKMESEGAVGLVLHGDATRAGYVAYVDLELPVVGQMDAVIKLPVNLGPQFMNSVLTQGGNNALDVQKDRIYAARFAREGRRLSFALNRAEMNADDAQYVEGRVGIALPQSTVQVQKLRILGEVDKAWYDAEVKKLEEK